MIMESNLIQQTLISIMIGSTEFRYICLALFGKLENILSYIKQFWMRSIRISGIIKAEVCVICRSEAVADNTNLALNNSSYPARTEFNNCFIIYL